MGNVNKKLISITGSSALYSAVNHAQKTLDTCGVLPFAKTFRIKNH